MVMVLVLVSTLHSELEVIDLFMNSSMVQVVMYPSHMVCDKNSTERLFCDAEYVIVVCGPRILTLMATGYILAQLFALPHLSTTFLYTFTYRQQRHVCRRASKNNYILSHCFQKPCKWYVNEIIGSWHKAGSPGATSIHDSCIVLVYWSWCLINQS